MTAKPDILDQLVTWICKEIPQLKPLQKLYMENQQLHRLIQYTFVSGLGYLLVLSLGYLFIDVMRTYWMIGSTAATLIAHLIKFMLQESWIYKVKQNKQVFSS